MADFAARQIALRAVGAAEFGDELARIENLVSALTPADSTPTAHPAARRAAGVFAVQVEQVIRAAGSPGSSAGAPGAAGAAVAAKLEQRPQRSPRSQGR